MLKQPQLTSGLDKNLNSCLPFGKRVQELACPPKKSKF